MSLGSDNDFPALADFYLNQILGFQDVNDMKSRSGRLRDAFQRQHGWDDNTVGDIPWNIAWPDWNLGDHVGDIGVPGETTYYGDGSHLTGAGDPQSLPGTPYSYYGTQLARIFGGFTTQYVYIDIPIYDISKRSHFFNGINYKRESIMYNPAGPAFNQWDYFVFLCGGTGGYSFSYFKHCFIDRIQVYYNSIQSRWESKFYGYLDVEMHDHDGSGIDFNTNSGHAYSSIGVPGANFTWSSHVTYILYLQESPTRLQLMNAGCGYGRGIVNGRLYLAGNILKMDLEFYAAGTDGGWGNSGYLMANEVGTIG